MICKQCDRLIPDQVNYCRYCGAKCEGTVVPIIKPKAPVPPEKPKAPAKVKAPAEKPKTPTKTTEPKAANEKTDRRPLVIGAVAIGCILLALLIWWLWPKGIPELPVEDPPITDTPSDPSVQDPNVEPIPDEPIVYAASIEGDSKVAVGKSIKLTATLTPEAEISHIVWTSSNETVATVDNGTVSGISEGETTLRVLMQTADNQVVEGELIFTVEPAPVTYHAVMEPSSLSLQAGSADEFKIVVSAEPKQEVIDHTVTWKTSDSLVAAVTDGRVQAVGEGEASITAQVSLPGGKLIVLQGKVTVTPAPAAKPDNSGTSSPSTPPINSNPSTPDNTTPSKPDNTTPSTPDNTTPSKPDNSSPSTPNSPTLVPAPEGEALITTEDYLVSNSSTAYISIASLDKLSEKELILARNEIYARHGRRFDTDWIQEYFDSQSWYNGTIAPNDFDPSVFNHYEVVNLSRMQYVESTL